jgi:acyl-CoA synthetase (AMP-forming)/AMP-acid ligase II
MFEHHKPPPSFRPQQLLIKDLLRFPLMMTGQQEIIYRNRVRYTYDEFARRIARLAHALRKLGIGPGDTVAILDWDSHRYLECYFAVPMIGAVLHTVNIRLSPEHVAFTLNHAEDALILVHSDFLPLLKGIVGRLASGKKRVLLSDDASGAAADLSFEGEYEELLLAESDTFEFPDFDENRVATVFYTTGTTGGPKGVYYTHRQLVLHTLALISVLAGYQNQFTITSDDVYMPLTPMFHVHAWGLPYMMTTLGARQVYPGRYEPEQILQLMGREGVTFSHCVPTILHLLLNCPGTEEADLEGWKLVVGGSPLSRNLCGAALSRGINVVSGYGLSETCPVITLSCLTPRMLALPLEEQIQYRCRTGLPTPFVHVEVIDPLGNPLPHDGVSVGEVVVKSPWLTQGYLKEPQLSEDLWRDGWLHTGDIGYFTEDGYLQITDRIKDVIKTGGEWISSLELEDIICQHEAVSEAAVIGVPDEKWGERPLALVVLKEAFKGRVDEEALRAFFVQFANEGRIPRYAVPKKLLLVDAISKTSVGKVSKANLRRNLQFGPNP